MKTSNYHSGIGAAHTISRAYVDLLSQLSISSDEQLFKLMGYMLGSVDAMLYTPETISEKLKQTSKMRGHEPGLIRFAHSSIARNCAMYTAMVLESLEYQIKRCKVYEILSQDILTKMESIVYKSEGKAPGQVSITDLHDLARSCRSESSLKRNGPIGAIAPIVDRFLRICLGLSQTQAKNVHSHIDIHMPVLSIVSDLAVIMNNESSAKLTEEMFTSEDVMHMYNYNISDCTIAAAPGINAYILKTLSGDRCNRMTSRAARYAFCALRI